MSALHVRTLTSPFRSRLQVHSCSAAWSEPCPTHPFRIGSPPHLSSHLPWQHTAWPTVTNCVCGMCASPSCLQLWEAGNLSLLLVTTPPALSPGLGQSRCSTSEWMDVALWGPGEADWVEGAAGWVQQRKPQSQKRGSSLKKPSRADSSKTLSKSLWKLARWPSVCVSPYLPRVQMARPAQSAGSWQRNYIPSSSSALPSSSWCPTA